MLSSDVMRGFNSLLILSVLSNGDSYGYKISQQIKQKSDGQYAMKETTLYSVFNRLEKQSLIEAYSSDETHGKPRTYYTITEQGKIVFAEKKQEWELVKHLINQFIKGENEI